MTRTLQLASKILSLAGQIDITDQSGALAYEARAEFQLGGAHWDLFNGDVRLATLRRPRWAWNPPWRIDSFQGEWALKRKLFSMTRHYTVLGGPYDGATVSGNLWDRSFVIDHRGTTLARASSRLLSLRDVHEVQILHPDAELLCVLALVIVKDDRRSAAASDGD